MGMGSRLPDAQWFRVLLKFNADGDHGDLGPSASAVWISAYVDPITGPGQDEDLAIFLAGRLQLVEMKESRRRMYGGTCKSNALFSSRIRLARSRLCMASNTSLDTA